MTEDLILERIKNVLKKECGITMEINNMFNLDTDLGFDSLDKIELWLILEEEFKVDIPDEEAKLIITIQDCIDLVKKYIKDENISNQS